MLQGVKDENNNFVRHPAQMAELLSKQFESVFSVPLQDLTNLNLQPRNLPELNDLDFSPEDIKCAIRDMNSSSAPGPDGIPPSLYKDYADQLAEPIYHL